MKTENIGYWWLGDEIRTPGGRKVKAKIWWGVCKKTRKVALVGTTNIHPILVTSTHITEYDGKKECFDAPSCLNIDCPYADNHKLIDSINKSSFKDINTDENLINFFNQAFENISNYFESMDESNLKEHFEDAYDQTTITDPAFETKLPK